jgi:hypothetical protein
LALAGCSGGGGGATISGTVTFNGAPLEKGSITFTPEDGKGTPAGGMIENGKYTATGVTSGKNRVEIVSDAGVKYPSSQEEAARMKDAELRGKQIVGPDDEGNNHVKDIKGNETINFDIKSRPRRS